MTERAPDALSHWRAERRAFQRIYDVVVGTTEPVTAGWVGERADCATPAARGALEQLVEMGVVERCPGELPNYRRNESYLAWKREDGLAREHDADRLRERAEECAAAAANYREQFGVAAPDDLPSEPSEWTGGAWSDAMAEAAPDADSAADNDHDRIEERWRARVDWSTARRDAALLERAAERVERGDERRRTGRPQS